MNKFLFLWCIIGLKSYPDRKGTLNKAGMVVCMKHQNSILLFISTPIDVSSKQLSIKSEGKNLLSINCLHMDHPVLPDIWRLLWLLQLPGNPRSGCTSGALYVALVSVIQE